MNSSSDGLYGIVLTENPFSTASWNSRRLHAHGIYQGVSSVVTY